MQNDEERKTHDIAAAWIAYGLFLLLVVAVSAALSLADHSAARPGPTVQDVPRPAASEQRAPREATWRAERVRAID